MDAFLRVLSGGRCHVFRDQYPFALDLGTDGYTQFPAVAPDARVIYVSDSLGNDSNNGLSPKAPLKTLLEGVRRLRSGFPDRLLLRAGDTWTGQTLNEPFYNANVFMKSGRSRQERMLISSYGEGARPRIVPPPNARVLSTFGDFGISHVWIVGLEVDAEQLAGHSDNAIVLYPRCLDVGVEDCLIRGTTGSLNTTGDGPFREVVFRRNVVYRTYAASCNTTAGWLYLPSVQGGVVEENVFDTNGWIPSANNATVFNQAIYLGANSEEVYIVGNIVANASAGGIQVRGLTQFAFDNLVVRTPIGIGAGNATQNWPSQAWRGSIAWNCVLDARDIVRQDTQPTPSVPGTQPCADPGNVQGWGITWGRTRFGTICNNLIAHTHGDLAAKNGSGLYTSRDTDPAAGTGPATIAENVVYNWRGREGNGTALNIEQRTLYAGADGPEVLRDNRFSQPISGVLASFGGTVASCSGSLSGVWQRNKYWAAGPQDISWFTRCPPFADCFCPWINWQGNLTSDKHATNTPISFPDPTRTIETYMARLDRHPATTDTFLAEARLMRRGNYRPDFTASVVNSYLRAGYGICDP